MLNPKSLLQNGLRKLGYEIRRADVETKLPPDFEPDFHEIFRRCSPFSMTSPERMYSLYRSVQYIEDHKIPGAFVECGVWRGGSSMVMAHTLLKQSKKPKRELYLYDTYSGMSAPTEADRTVFGKDAAPKFQETAKEDHTDWCYASLDEVKSNLQSTGYPASKLHFIKGKVEDTIPATIPDEIALLRLDTDFYESTYHELIHLFPRLKAGGILIIDDYGHWLGAKDATDRYFAEHGMKPFLHRIDYTARMLVKSH